MGDSGYSQEDIEKMPHLYSHEASYGNLSPMAIILRDEKLQIPMEMRLILADMIQGVGFSRLSGRVLTTKLHPDFTNYNQTSKNKSARNMMVHEIATYMHREGYTNKGLHEGKVMSLGGVNHFRSKKEAVHNVAIIFKISERKVMYYWKAYNIAKNIHTLIEEKYTKENLGYVSIFDTLNYLAYWDTKNDPTGNINALVEDFENCFPKKRVANKK